MEKYDYSKLGVKEQLSDAENTYLFKQMKDGVDYRNIIILYNLSLIKNVIDGCDTDYDKEELFQIGVLELIDCVDKFDCDKRKSFIKYATKNIKSKINATIKKLPEYENKLNYGNTINIDDNDLINNEFIIDYFFIF